MRGFPNQSVRPLDFQLTALFRLQLLYGQCSQAKLSLIILESLKKSLH